MSERPRIRPGQASPGWVAGAQREPREGDDHATGQRHLPQVRGDRPDRPEQRPEEVPELRRPRERLAAGLAGERWKPIPASRLLGIPAGYEASSEGRVRSPRQVLTQRDDKDGYPTVKVGGKPRRVAILVQLAWAGPPQVCHVDDDRSNSRADNLLWRSKVENEQMKGKKGKEIRDGMEWVPPFPSGTPGTAELH